MNLLEYKKNAITYLDLVRGEVLKYQEKVQEIQEQINKGLVTVLYLNEKRGILKREAEEKILPLYNQLKNIRQEVEDKELEVLTELQNKDVKIDNFAELEALKMLDYSKVENIKIFKDYAEKYRGNKLAVAILKQIEEEAGKKRNWIFSDLPEEGVNDVETFLKQYISRVDSYILQFYIINYEDNLAWLDMYFTGAKETINVDYNRYLKMKEKIK